MHVLFVILIHLTSSQIQRKRLSSWYEMTNQDNSWEGELCQYLFPSPGDDESGVTVSLTIFGVKNKAWQMHWIMTIEVLL